MFHFAVETVESDRAREIDSQTGKKVEGHREKRSEKQREARSREKERKRRAFSLAPNLARACATLLHINKLLA